MVLERFCSSPTIVSIDRYISVASLFFCSVALVHVDLCGIVKRDVSSVQLLNIPCRQMQIFLVARDILYILVCE